MNLTGKQRNGAPCGRKQIRWDFMGKLARCSSTEDKQAVKSTDRIETQQHADRVKTLHKSAEMLDGSRVFWLELEFG